MVLDSSALLAIMLDEPEAVPFVDAIERDSRRLVGSPTLVEAFVALERRRRGRGTDLMNVLVPSLGLEEALFDARHTLLAQAAFERYGKGRHPAALNLGDCFTYALCKERDEPLLFKGNDFSQTDLVAVRY